MKINPPDFIIIPRQLLEDRRVTLVEERLYGVIYWFTRLKNESCTASNVTLAHLVKSTPGTVKNALIRLEEMGYVKRMYKDASRRIRSEIVPLVVFAKVAPTDAKVAPTDATGVAPTDAHNNKKVKEEKKKERASDPEGPRLGDLIELFKDVNPTHYTLFSNKTQRAALERLVERFGHEKISGAIKALPGIINKKYAPRITTPLQLEQKFGELVAFAKQEKSTGGIIKSTDR